MASFVPGSMRRGSRGDERVGGTTNQTGAVGSGGTGTTRTTDASGTESGRFLICFVLFCFDHLLFTPSLNPLNLIFDRAPCTGK